MPAKKYEAPRLKRITSDDPDLQEKLPAIRRLTEQALREVQMAGDADIEARLKRLLEHIDDQAGHFRRDRQVLIPPDWM